MQAHDLELFADYFQFYLQDETADGNLAESWDQKAVDRLLALAAGTIGIGTVRNMNVPVRIEVHESAPTLETDGWDQVNECSIEIASGKIVVAGCTDYFPDATRITVSPGCYRVRILYGRLDSLSADKLDGNDRYKVLLWRDVHREVRIVKQRTIEGGA